MFTAGRVEYSHERSEFTWAEHLLTRAESAFSKFGHPFRWRAANQRARCLLRQGRVREARLAAERIPDHDGSGDREKLYAHGDRQLTLTWICERANTPAAWEEALGHARFLVANKRRLPTRLAAEGYLHRGIARTNLGHARAHALGDLKQASKLAEKASSTKLTIACHLAIADLLTRSDIGGDSSLAAQHAVRAEQLLAGVESHFLRGWHLRVASRLDKSLPIVIDVQWESALREYRQAYYLYHIAKSGSVKDFLGRTGWGKNTYDKYRREFGRSVPRGRSNASGGSSDADQS
jgi:tetratricopeptide (TPR) repeat protein